MGTLLGDEVVRLMPLELIVLFCGLFAILGFTRGVRAETWVMAFILIAFVVLQTLGDTVVKYANQIYRLLGFALAGGIIADNPVEIWQRFAGKPPLIETETEKVLFRLALFLLFYLLGLLAGRIAVRRKLTPLGFRLIRQLPDLGERLLGTVLGAVNGFLIAMFVLPRVLPAEKETVIVVPKTRVITDFMTENLGNIAFAVIVVIILLGLMATGGIRQRG